MHIARGRKRIHFTAAGEQMNRHYSTSECASYGAPDKLVQRMNTVRQYPGNDNYPHSNQSASRLRDRGSRRRTLWVIQPGARYWEVACPNPGRMFTVMKAAIDPKLFDDPLFRELMAEGLAMQDRFSAEPVYARTGKGYLKSVGVEDLQKIKATRKPKPS